MTGVQTCALPISNCFIFICIACGEIIECCFKNALHKSLLIKEYLANLFASSSHLFISVGKLEEKRFKLLCAEYEKEQAELEQLLVSEQAQLDQFHEDTDRASHFLALAQKYTDFTQLTAPMIHEFVEKILVHAPDRSTGERVQEIEIYLDRKSVV